MQSGLLKRREFITLLGGAASWPFAARAQPTERVRRIGVLMSLPENDPLTQRYLKEFNQGLQELGWFEGRNIRVDYRFAPADIERMQRLANELVNSRPDLVVGNTTPGTAVLARETKTIPIVFVVVSDPVGSGFVASLARPGGNVTGFINIEGSMGGKWAEFLKEVSPRLARAAFLYNPETAPYYSYYLAPFEAASRSLDAEPVPSPIHRIEDIEPIIRALSERPDSGIAVMPDTFTNARPVFNEIISLAARH